ncbi:MAG TPA: CapA family protein [Cyclobacteriaceae bacterium]
MRYFAWIILILSSCASSRLAKQSSSGISKLRSDTVIVKVDSLLIHKGTTQIQIGQMRIDTVVIAKRDTLTIIGVGDIMMGTNYPNEDRLPPDNARHLMAAVKDILKDADVTMGNLEGVLLDEGGTPKGCRNPDVCYVFRSPTSFAQNLVDAGFDMMSLANNHAGDFGDAGRQSSMQTLDSLNIEFAGLISKPYAVFKRDEVRYGFAAFAPNTGCASINDLETAKATIMHLDSIADIVIVSFHGGAEGSKYEHVPRQHELFVGEDRGDVYLFTHTLIDAGADILFGHGPHVTRAIEVYKERFIAYSLGNFCTYGGFNLNGVNGLAPIVKVYTNPDGVFYKAKITPIYQTPMSPINIDIRGRVIERIRELTQGDFPETPITIGLDGWVKYSTK